MKLKNNEYKFCTELHAKLKTEVKGKVYTTIEDGDLLVEIHYKDLKYELKFIDYEEGIIRNNATVDDFARAVVESYKDFIIDRYFYD